MESLTFSLSAYGLTILFAMIIACLIPALAWVIKKMNLDPATEQSDLAIPSSDSIQEEQAVAVAIAVAHLQRK